ncbi:MAG: GDSL-type esterase/lipase family protein [Gemmatales bacterium]
MKLMSIAACVVLSFVTLWTAAAQPATPPRLELKPGDHVCIIGNTTADRMQYFGWMETLLHSRFPEHHLTVRNLGFAGDTLTTRLRSASFGTPDEWLTKCQADVVFAFFGYNESFAGKDGLDKFKSDLDDFITHTLAQKYNGKSTPKLVLFSPLAHENLKNPNLPDGTENNPRLRLYSEAMSEAAKKHNIVFVDLCIPTKQLFDEGGQPSTINGVHLNERGDQKVARIIEKSLFTTPIEKETEYLEKLRKAVNDKNFYWFERYRTTDGYSIFGGRADLKFVDGQTNREVAQREMEVLDVMTANRDKHVWSVAQNKEEKVDDSNIPPFVPVKTNKPGKGPNGEHIILDGTEAIKSMTVAKGFKVNLFADEKMFPELVNPVQMSWDTKGRLWVACWQTYPHWKPTEKMNDKLLILEDTDGDGKADKCTVFAGDLHNPTGFEFWNGGVIVAQSPNIVFLKDTNGDDKYDTKEIILSGIDSADTHHTANSFVLGPDGALYFQEGTFHQTSVETPYSAPVRCSNAGVFRYEPRTQKFDTYVSFGFANPHGHVFDRWGRDIVVDGTGSNPYHAALFSGHVEYPNKHGRPPQVYQQWTRPCSGMEILSSKHFPDELQGNLLVLNVIGYQGILMYKLRDQGASIVGTEDTRLLSSSDPNFRPADIKMGPDGAMYFCDWHNPIIGHMQHNLRDPSRDRTHGRVYRVTYEGRELSQLPKIAGEPVEKLLDLLKYHEERVRYRARIELSSRPSVEVREKLEAWLKTLAKMAPKVQDTDYEHHVLEALWLYQQFNHVDDDLLVTMLKSENASVRAASVRVLSYWHDRIPEALMMLRKQIEDPDPRVRLEVLRAASFLNEPEAVEIPLLFKASKHPSDQYLDFVYGETMKTLEPIWKKALAQGKPIKMLTSYGKRFLLRNTSTNAMLKMERNAEVCSELLTRPGMQDEYRHDALRNLARIKRLTQLQLLFETIRELDREEESTDKSIYFDLARLIAGRSPKELVEIRSDIEYLCRTAKQPIIRQVGYVALITADGNVTAAWKLTERSSNKLLAEQDFVTATSMISDSSLRDQAYIKLVEVMLRTTSVAAPKPTQARFVRIDLPGKNKTLTLAEVEVFSKSQNIARQGTAKQSGTSNGGVAARAIDGNTSGSYNNGGQTHSPENSTNPWWEVDLGQDHPIESINIYNRTDDRLGRRLEGYTITLLDGNRQQVWQRTKQPAPEKMATFAIAPYDPQAELRQATMLAMTTVRGQEKNTFELLSGLVRQNKGDQTAAMQALLRLPKNTWPVDQAKPLLEQTLAVLRAIPVNQRTGPAALQAMELAESLTTLLPPDQSKPFRRELLDLGVRVIRVGTLLERMSFDKDVIVVQAGMPVEFIFDNTDMMPHNLVISQPGTLEMIGEAAEASATSPDAAARSFVPRSDTILLASKLLQPRESQRLSFTAPTTPGVYPIICTYPGHWRRMYSALYVVSDLEGYQTGPDAYLVAHPLPVKDAMLKDRRPRTEWKLADLEPMVAELKGGRSFGNGKQMFKVASCVACHKFDGQGNNFAPDLTQLDPKWTHTDLIKNIVEPSFQINEKFQPWVFAMNDGKTVTGIILEEKPDSYKVIENPILKAEPIILKKADVEQKQKSNVSTMPKGLLDTLSRDEILDLLAYIISKGKPEHELFKGEKHNH